MSKSWTCSGGHVEVALIGIFNSETGKLSDLIRDLKKFTSSKIVLAIKENKYESRKRMPAWPKAGALLVLKKKDEFVRSICGYYYPIRKVLLRLAAV